METDSETLERLGTDAELWAAGLHKAHRENGGLSEDLAQTWFANAIEAGRSAGYAEGVRAAYQCLDEDPGLIPAQQWSLEDAFPFLQKAHDSDARADHA